MTGSLTSGQSIAEFALRLVRTPSLSAQEGGVAALVQAEMERLGFDVAVDELGNVTGTIGSGSGPIVLLDSHMDTVGIGDPDAWSHDPHGEVVDGRLHGRGAMDMKGPLAAAMRGIASLPEKLVSGTIVVAATIAEELVEGTALERVAKRVNPDYVIICEATSLKIARGQRGRAEISVEVRGRATHSSRPDLGVNAAEAMAGAVVALRSLQAPRHEVLGDGILVLTDVMSHPYPGLSVVPERCVATFDRRTLPGETEELVLEPVRDLVTEALIGTGASARVSLAEDNFRSYTGSQVTALNFAPAWFFDANEPVVRTAKTALIDANLGGELSHYAFCTNGSGTAGRLGIPTIGFGPGDEDLAHRVDEYIEIEDLELAARGYAAIASALVSLER